MSQTDSELSLANILKQPNFEPTVALEKCLAETFCRKLEKAVKERFSLHSLGVFQQYLGYVFDVAEKDEKFVPLYFGAREASFYSDLISLLRSTEKLSVENSQFLQIMVLKFAVCIMVSVPNKRCTFAGIGLQHFILNEPKVMNRDLLFYQVQILQMLSEVQVVLEEISSPYTVDLVLDYLQFFTKATAVDWELNESAVNSLLEILSKISHKTSFNDMNLIAKIGNVHSSLVKAFPALNQTIDEVLKPLSEYVGSSRSSNQRSNASLKVGRLSKSFAFSMSIADIKSNDSKTLGPVQNHIFEDEMVPLRRHEYVNMGDLELNFYSNEKNISEISLNATAEVICGMLNSNKGGIIHFGLDVSGRIDGLLVNHSQRDEFRSGVDNLFLTALTPILPSSLVKIIFIPITGDRKLHLIRIIIPPKMSTIYYLKNRDVCFVRRSQGNVKLTLNEIRQLSISLCEKRFIV